MVGLNGAQMSSALFAAEFAIDGIDHPSVFDPTALGWVDHQWAFGHCHPRQSAWYNIHRTIAMWQYKRAQINMARCDATGDRGWVGGQTNGRLGDKPCWVI